MILPTGKLHLTASQTENPSYRSVATVTNEKIIKGGTVTVYVGVLDHMDAMEKKTSNDINPEIKKANVVAIVGSLGGELGAEKTKFNEIVLGL